MPTPTKSTLRQLPTGIWVLGSGNCKGLAVFGLRQSLDTMGAFLGPLLAVGLMLL